MKAVATVVDRLIGVIGVLVGLVVLLMMLHITLEVGLRYFFSSTLGGTIEIVANYYMVTLGFLSLAFIEIRNRHIEVDLFARSAGAGGQKRIRIIGALASGSIITVLLIRTWQEATKKYDLGASVMAGDFYLPVWPAFFIVPAGCGLMLLVLLLKIALEFSGYNPAEVLGREEHAV